MSTLEMLLNEGEEIGIKKGIQREKALNSLITLLKVFDKFPHWTVAEIIQFTEIKKKLVLALQSAFATKKKRAIQQVIKTQLLPNIKLTKIERTKINHLVALVLKKK